MGEGIEPPQGPIRRQVYTVISLFTVGVDCEIQSGGRMTPFSKVFIPHPEGKTTVSADLGHVRPPPLKLSAATNWTIVQMPAFQGILQCASTASHDNDRSPWTTVGKISK